MGFHGATALVAVAATGPCLLGAVRTLSAPARRRVRRWTFGLIALAIVVSIPVAVAALLAHSELGQGISQTEGALGSIGNGTTTSGAAQLQAASTDFASAASSTDSWWTAAARLVPVVAQQRQALGQASAVASDVTATAADQASGINYQQLRYSDGQLDLDQVNALAGPLDIVSNQLTAATATAPVPAVGMAASSRWSPAWTSWTPRSSGPRPAPRWPRRWCRPRPPFSGETASATTSSPS